MFAGLIVVILALAVADIRWRQRAAVSIPALNRFKSESVCLHFLSARRLSFRDQRQYSRSVSNSGWSIPQILFEY
jgi:hypothetical protein